MLGTTAAASAASGEEAADKPADAVCPETEDQLDALFNLFLSTTRKLQRAEAQ